MRAAVMAISAISLWGCGSAPPHAVLPPPPPPAAKAAPSEPSGIPADYVDAHVLDVVATNQGAAVLLLDESTLAVLPIFVGGTEATSIDLRKRGVPAQRPLTHDLLDTVLERLRGKLVKVQVDELRDGIFYGSIFIRTERRIIKLDARPSDALALAIGNKVPIYVARRVMTEAGIPKDEILRQLSRPGEPTI
jgi:bifunctional DNase/RNase